MVNSRYTKLADSARLALIEMLAEANLPSRERIAIGEKLAKIGDSRRGLGLRVVGKYQIPDLELIYIPPGDFWMGSDDDVHADNIEKPQHLVDLSGYWISRYPITVGQVKQFLNDSKHKFVKPNLMDWHGIDSYPAMSITWYEANLFCEWYTKIGHREKWLSKKLKISLPSEAEYEKAARGGLELPKRPVVGYFGDALKYPKQVAMKENRNPKRLYPWGDEEPNENKAYLGQSDKPIIGDFMSHPVGCFPGGASPYGVEDMKGEWTRSLWGTSLETAFLYPYHANDGRESMKPNGERIIRGGVLGNQKQWFRCSHRSVPPVAGILGLITFRVVVSAH